MTSSPCFLQRLYGRKRQVGFFLKIQIILITAVDLALASKRRSWRQIRPFLPKVKVSHSGVGPFPGWQREEAHSHHQ